jgi:CRISPR system Cascade subunit CasC
MRIEIHVLQNFAPSNLNRDDTGSPKDAEFGGHRRARISSQCSKRAVRAYFEKEQLLDKRNLSARTKRYATYVSDKLSVHGRKAEDARFAALAALGTLGIRPPGDLVKAMATQIETNDTPIDEPLTSYLIFASQQELDQVVEVVNQHWDELTPKAFVKKLLKALAIAELPKRRTAVRKLVGEDISGRMDSMFAKGSVGTVAGDLALFGRMLADLPENNIDAACQVAHVISTNKIHSMEMDYYTAVDDLKPQDTAGADMIGTVEFNSACFYRYANLDLGQLRQNLQNDKELVRKTTEAFLHAFIHAIPTGKQNTFAAHNPPSLVFAVVRSGPPVSLANAFVRPVTPRGNESLIERSIAELDRYYGQIVKMYGDGGLAKAAVCQSEDGKLVHLKDDVGSVDALIKVIATAVFAGEEAK